MNMQEFKSALSGTFWGFIAIAILVSVLSVTTKPKPPVSAAATVSTSYSSYADYDGLHDEEEIYYYADDDAVYEEDDAEPTREFYRDIIVGPKVEIHTCYMRDVDRAWYDDGIGMFSNGHEIDCPD